MNTHRTFVPHIQSGYENIATNRMKIAELKRTRNDSAAKKEIDWRSRHIEIDQNLNSLMEKLNSERMRGEW